MEITRENVTDLMQEVAVDILTNFVLADNMKDVYRVYDEMFEKYGLMQDPYTFFPCTRERFMKNKVKFENKIARKEFSHQYIVS